MKNLVVNVKYPMLTKFTATVNSVITLHNQTYQFLINLNQPLEFAPGQYLLLNVPGIGANGKPHFARAYSIAGFEGGVCNAQTHTIKTNTLKLIIKLEANGVASEYIKTLSAGTTVAIEAPAGHFKFSYQPQTVQGKFCNVFIAASTGIAPFFTFLEYQLASGELNSTQLLWSSKTCNGIYNSTLRASFANALQTKALKYEEKFFITADELPQGQNYLKGRLTNYLNNPDTLGANKFYICGGRNFVVDVKKKLIELGVQGNKIVFERFN